MSEKKSYPDSEGTWKCIDTFLHSVAEFKVIKREGQLVCIGTKSEAEFTQDTFQEDPYVHFEKVE